MSLIDNEKAQVKTLDQTNFLFATRGVCICNGYLCVTGFVHQDFNESNIIVRRPIKEVLNADDDRLLELFGLIDFGDSCYSYYVFELAILIVYVMVYAMKQGSSNYLSLATTAFKAYDKMMNVTEAEHDVLYGTILVRMCFSLAHSINFSEVRPDNEEYINSDAKQVMSLLNVVLDLGKNQFLHLLTYSS